MNVYDLLYGRFELPRYLSTLVSAPEFRRLAEIRLININSPTLSALSDVRRYSHTLGVLRLALHNPLLGFGPDEHRALLASILVHDAGTPAFAHLFEYQLMVRFNWNHEAVLPDVMLKRHHTDQMHHQLFHSRRPDFERLCKKAGIDFDLVLSILNGTHRGSKLLFGTIDFDNLDNVARMTKMLGFDLDIGVITRIANELGVDSQHRLLLPIDRMSDINEWVKFRNQSYNVLVFDPQTVAAQAVLSSVIASALDEGVLSDIDWKYTDSELLTVLSGSSSNAKNRLERDFHGTLPEMRLLIHLTDRAHPLRSVHPRTIATLVERYLNELGMPRAYGYSFSDRGTFQKRIAAIDPDTGAEWSTGTQSDSLVIYGFSATGPKRHTPRELGVNFVKWAEKITC